MPNTQGRRTIVMIAGLVCFASLAGYVYRPYVARPFDMVDFSEFLPILRTHSSLGSRLVAMIRYYAEQGRLNPVVVLFIATKWTAFGDHTAAWQMLRAGQMLALTGLTYALLRRLQISVAGALAGAALLVVSAPAARGWVRLTMAEPFGMTAIVAATLIGTYYQSSVRWRRLAIAMIGLMAVTLLTKELLVAAVPVVLFISWCRTPDGWIGRPQLSRRNIELLALTSFMAITALLPSVLVALRASPDAYVASYGSGSVGPLDLLRLELFTLIPFVPIGDPTPPGVMIAGLSYFALLAVGLKLFASTSPSRWHTWSIFGVGFVYPLLGAAIYLPWPAYQWFYSLPYLLGPAALIGAAITGIERAAPGWRAVAYGGAACVFANMTSDAALLARRAEASQFLASTTADVVSQTPTLDSAFVAAREIPRQSWQGFGQTLARYARGTGRSFPPTVDITCDEAGRRMGRVGERSILIVFSTHCPISDSGATRLSRSFEWPDWGNGAIRHDSISVAIFTNPRRLTTSAAK